MLKGWLPRIAARNLARHWRRSALAILSIASGYAAVNLFEGYIAAAEQIFDDTYSQRMMYGQILIHPEGEAPGALISPEDQARVEGILRATSEVRASARFLLVSGLASNGRTSSAFLGYGYDVAQGLVLRGPSWAWNTLAGKPLAPGASASAELGQGLGKLMDCLPLERLPSIMALGGYPAEERPFRCRSPELELTVGTVGGRTNAASVRIAGLVDAVYAESDARYVAIPLDAAQRLLDTGGVSYYSVALGDPGLQAEVARELQRKLDEARLPLKATRWKDHAIGEIYVQSMQFLAVFRDFTLLVALAIVAQSVLALFTRLVQERAVEIGTLRSLGFRPAQLRNLFLAEAALAAICGIAIGSVAAVLIAAFVNEAGILYKIGILAEKVPFRVDMPFGNFLIGAGALAALALAAAWRAIRGVLARDIPDCLGRHREA